MLCVWEKGEQAILKYNHFMADFAEKEGREKVAADAVGYEDVRQEIDLSLSGIHLSPSPFSGDHVEPTYNKSYNATMPLLYIP